jgi:hypothetical protein
MKIGDAVKMKFITDGQARRAKMFGRPVDEIGIVVELSDRISKVIFPNHGGKIYAILISNLELVACL